MFTEGTAPQRLPESSAAKLAPLGARLIDKYGRVFRYTRNGATALTGGALCQVSSALTSTHVLGRVLTGSLTDGGSTPTGVRGLRITSVTSSFAENYFAEGIYAAGAGDNFSLPVSGHAAMTASSGAQIKFASPAPVSPGAAGSNRSGIFINPFDSVVVCGTSYARPPICVPQQTVPANHYFWGLVEGHGLGLYAGALIEGVAVTPSLATAGAVSTISDDLSSLTTGGRNATTVVGFCLAYGSWSATTGCFINWRL